MKPRCSHRRDRALTRMEVVVVLSLVAVVSAWLLFGMHEAVKKLRRMDCVNNLRQIGLAYRVWAGDHYDQNPIVASVTNMDGTIHFLREGIPDSQLVRWNFMVMSNALATPRLLHCPSDSRVMAENFTENFGNANVSYFISLDATEDYPETILSGDDNLTVNGVPAGAGRLDLSSNTTVGWTKDRHHKVGNVGMADGSVIQINSNLLNDMKQTGFATNRLVLP